MVKRGIKFHYLWKAFLIIPIVFICNVNIIMTVGGIDSSVRDLLANALFEVAKMKDMKVYVLVIERMYFIFVFNMIYGTYIYHDFQVSSIYVFTRLRDRKKWFYKNVVELIGFALIYTFLFLVTLLVVCMYGSNYQVDEDSIKMLGTLFIFITLFLTATTLVINLLSIRFNSSVGFICVYIALLIFTTFVLKSGQLHLFAENPYLALLNPVAAIILNLAHDFKMKLTATVYYLMINGIIAILGARYTNSLEVGLMDKDRDG